MAGMFHNKVKILQEMLDKELERNVIIGEKLSESNRKLSELEDFLRFITFMLHEKGWRLYGLENFENEKIAFFLKSTYEQKPQFVYDYVLHAYLSNNLNSPIYRAQLEWRFDSRFEQEKRLFISSQSVEDDSLRGHGLGTMSFEKIKDLAKELQCDSINGLRRPMTQFRTEEERKAGEQKLYQFYDKLGIEQSAESDKIRFVLRK